MPHSDVHCPLHYIFSTKRRRNLILPDFREKLWAYMGGIARVNKTPAMAVGGMGEHAHVVLSLNSTTSIAKAIQLVKGGSSKWVRGTFPAAWDFEWQEGYSAYAVSESLLDNVHDYIARQEEHHRKMTFEEEYIAFLEKHGIPYDRRYVFD
jgi:putative transposase